MNRLVVALAGTCLAFTASSCDDDDPKKTDAAVEAGVGDTTAGMCTGTFQQYTRAQLQANTQPTGNCAAATDLDLICTGNIGDRIRGYGKDCVSGGATEANALRTCITTAVNKNHTFSASCLGCYIGSVSCSLQFCAAVCTADATSPACVTCQQQNGCLTAFFTCAGIRPPGAPATDAGTDAAADAKLDAGVDASPDAATDAEEQEDAEPETDEGESDAGEDDAGETDAGEDDAGEDDAGEEDAEAETD